MRLFVRLFLWLSSLGAIAAAALLVVLGIMAPEASDFGQSALKALGLAAIGGSVPALAFAVAVNPWLSRMIPGLKEARGRWIAAILSVLTGGACAAAMVWFGIAAQQHVIYRTDPSPARFFRDNAFMPEVMGRGATFDSLVFGQDAAAPLGAGGADRTAPSFEMLCELVAEPERVAALRSEQDSLIVIELAEAIRLCTADEGRFSETFEMLRVQAANDVPVAQALLGLRYRDGIGVAKNEDEAIALFRRAAEHSESYRDSVLAQYLLADAFERGLGSLETNLSEAERLYNKAAEAGQTNAAARLVWAYATGEFGSRDPQKAEALSASLCDSCAIFEAGTGDFVGAASAFNEFARRCEEGLPDACFVAGAYRAGGLGAAADTAAARAFLERGCAAGHYRSCRSLDVLGQR